MTRLVLLFALCCLGLPAQTLTFAIHDSTGATADTPLPSSYQFASTPQGNAANTVIKLANSGSSAVLVVLVYVGDIAGSPIATPNFSVTGLNQDAVIAPGSSEYFTLNFTPFSTGLQTGYLQVAYIAQQSDCTLSDIPQCPTVIAPVSTLSGTGAEPQLLLSYNQGGTSISPRPDSTSRLDFGNISTSATSSITFTLTNETSTAIPTPTVTVRADVFGSSAFALSAANLPASIPANGSGTFAVTFAPGQTGLATATLAVGTNTYGIEGTGIVVTDIDALQISYVDATGVRGSPQAATPISFGQFVPGAGGSSTLNFTVTNPATSFNPVTVSTLAVSGSAFTLTGAPALPVTIQPNSSITFAIAFSASASGTFTGTLSIGARQFALTGLSVVSPVPSISLQMSAQPLKSQQQATLTITASAPATSSNIGQLTMEFTPSVSNVGDDPAIIFLASSGRQLQVNLAAGSQTATYQGQSALIFQTGTTAGTITFTLTFPNTAPITKAFSITPAQIYVSGGQAVRQAPNLVITLNGYDNTYTAGQLSFTFFDAGGNRINANPIAVDATSTFHNYFFTNNQAGGAFALQVSFPVTGDVTKVGSVAVTMTNSAGQTTTNLTFQ